MSSDQYPEHTKLDAVRVEYDTILDFIEYSGYIIAEFDYDEGFPSGPQPANKTPYDIAMEYLGIDPLRIEMERRDMLEELRKELES